MKPSIKNQLILAAVCALGAAATAVAQSAPAPAPIASSGLIGTTYAGAEFGYTHNVQSGPSVLHRYGFIYNAPLPEGVDFDFKYNYLTGSAGGIKAHAQDVDLGLTGYLPQSWGKPFLNGDIGWIFQKAGSVRQDSFVYTLKTGVEFQIIPTLVVVPYVAYTEAPHFGGRDWLYGAKADYRFTHQWSGVVGAQIDEHHNLEYTVGVNFHY